jgi:hypothetical protein
MCELPDRLEIYTAAATYMVQPPEVTDPERTNPNAKWVIAKTDDLGCSAPAVARSFLMASRVLKQANLDPPIDRTAILAQMHVIKGLLVTCAKTAANFSGTVQTEVDATDRERGSPAHGGRALAHFPIINDLDQIATTSLISAKRTIREICQLINLFFDLNRSHSRLDYLVAELATKVGDDNALIKYLTGFTGFAARVGKLRDGQEHSGSTAARLYVENFKMMPTNQIRAPVWYLEGEQPRDINTDMSFIEKSLIELVEGAFVGCVDYCLPDRFPMCFKFNDNPKPEAPVRYELVIDMSRFRVDSPGSPSPT